MIHLKVGTIMHKFKKKSQEIILYNWIRSTGFFAFCELNVEIVFFRYYIIKVNWCPSDCVRGNDALSDCVFASDGNSSGFLFLREEYCTTIGVWKQSVVARLLVPRTLRRYTWKLKSNPKETQEKKKATLYIELYSLIFGILFSLWVQGETVSDFRKEFLYCVLMRSNVNNSYIPIVWAPRALKMLGAKIVHQQFVIEPLVNTTRAWMINPLVCQ